MDNLMQWNAVDNNRIEEFLLHLERKKWKTLNGKRNFNAEKNRIELHSFPYTDDSVIFIQIFICHAYEIRAEEVGSLKIELLSEGMFWKWKIPQKLGVTKMIFPHSSCTSLE